MRIEIIGGLGVGKTTLCAGLTRLGFRCVGEDLNQNQYLSLAYQDPESFGVYSQISFVLSNHFIFRQNTAPDEVSIFDYSVINDRAYATLFLNPAERDMVLGLIDGMQDKEGRADLYLYLTCPAAVQMERIRLRNRDHERAITQDFVERLDGMLRHYAAQASDAGARMITIDTHKIDLMHDMGFVRQLGRDIQSISGLRPDPAAQPELALSGAAETYY